MSPEPHPFSKVLQTMLGGDDGRARYRLPDGVTLNEGDRVAVKRGDTMFVGTVRKIDGDTIEIGTPEPNPMQRTVETLNTIGVIDGVISNKPDAQ